MMSVKFLSIISYCLLGYKFGFCEMIPNGEPYKRVDVSS